MADDALDAEAIARAGDQVYELGSVLGREAGATVAPQRVIELASEWVPHARHSALTFLRPNRSPRTVATTGDVPSRVDRLQYRTGEGPCLDAAEDQEVIVANDLAREPRWTVFGPQCVTETGIGSMMSVRLSLSGDDRAALNFYAPGRNQFDDSDVSTASIFAPFAALALEQTLHEQDGLNFAAALSSNRQIGMAVGILMSRRGVTAETAFGLLVDASQRRSRKVREVAAEVELEGDLPAPDDHPRRGCRRVADSGAPPRAA